MKYVIFALLALLWLALAINLNHVKRLPQIVNCKTYESPKACQLRLGNSYEVIYSPTSTLFWAEKK